MSALIATRDVRVQRDQGHYDHGHQSSVIRVHAILQKK